MKKALELAAVWALPACLMFSIGVCTLASTFMNASQAMPALLIAAALTVLQVSAPMRARAAVILALAKNVPLTLYLCFWALQMAFMAHHSAFIAIAGILPLAAAIFTLIYDLLRPFRPAAQNNSKGNDE